MIFEQAKKAVTVATFFEEVLMATPKHFGSSLRYSVCPSCGKSSEQSGKVTVNATGWRCYSCLEKGDVVRAAHLYWGIPMVDAARQLVGEREDYRRSISDSVVSTTVARNDEAMLDAVKKLLDAPRATNEQAMQYLQSDRGLPTEVLEEAIARRLLVVLPDHPAHATRWLEKHVGKNLMVQAGLWKADKNAPSLAYRPIVSVRDSGKSVEFRLAHQPKDGEIKAISYGARSPWIWKGKEGKGILVVEGFLDLLSAVALGTERTIIGLTGCENYDVSWFGSPGPSDVLLALDADEAGERAIFGHTSKDGEAIPGLKQKLMDLGHKVFVHKLPDGCKDLNDQLRLKNAI